MSDLQDDVAEAIVNFGRFGIKHGWKEATKLAKACLYSAQGMQAKKANKEEKT